MKKPGINWVKYEEEEEEEGESDRGKRIVLHYSTATRSRFISPHQPHEKTQFSLTTASKQISPAPKVLLNILQWSESQSSNLMKSYRRGEE